MRLCQCGCGKEIVIKRHHKWAGIPNFVHGHNRKGEVVTEETRLKIRLIHIGLKASESSRKKMSESALGNWNQSEYRRLHSGINAPMYGKKQSEITKKIRSLAMTGKLNPFYGKTCTKAHREKISNANKGSKRTPAQRLRQSIASRNSLKTTWNGGSSFSPYSTDFTKILRDEIRMRDGYSCQLCGDIGKNNVSLSVHHIDYDKMNCDFENLVSLCSSCHPKTNVRREEWIEFFACREVVNA